MSFPFEMSESTKLYKAWKADPLNIQSHPLFPQFKHHLLCALCAEGDVANAIMLIERKGADPAFFGEGTLYAAVRCNCVELVEYLLTLPAVRAVSAKCCNRCLLEAQMRDYKAIVALLKSVPEIVEAGYDMEKYGYGCFESPDGPVTPVLPLVTTPPQQPTPFLHRVCRCLRLW